MSKGTTHKLNTGHSIPALGYGTYQPGSSSDQVAANVFEALKTGYRHLDLAPVYGNQAAVGRGLQHALKEIPGLKREDIFITSKLWNNAHQYEHVEAALDETLKECGLDYLDLFLVHWPVAFKRRGDAMFPVVKSAVDGVDEVELDDETSIKKTWVAMTALPKEKVRSVGVSNFSVAALESVIEATRVVPAVNQVERHPRLVEDGGLLKYCREKGIHVTAYSPLGNNNMGLPLAVDHPDVIRIAARKAVMPAQVVLAWAQVGGHSIIPKAATPGHIRENFQEVTITEEDVDSINQLGRLARQRFNIPFRFTPRWNIDVFGEHEEKGAAWKIVRGEYQERD